ncbi:hypothetical protein PAXINDRAFT_14534 [Paxillus involutus ATCC 200175]|uniref:Uncharacterized protein n=1 Tax=Paxillus involutus ATCC 200175 TaxID=664439 RepID=A0A0C9SUB5_PAXIN|nr:hypothetical protein PAXINDRAFT_14534 [Paxillus involutus ATCC 200175]
MACIFPLHAHWLSGCIKDFMKRAGDPATSARHQNRQPRIDARTSQHANSVRLDVALIYVRFRSSILSRRHDASSLGSAWALEGQWSVVGEPSAYGATCLYGRRTTDLMLLLKTFNCLPRNVPSDFHRRYPAI